MLELQAGVGFGGAAKRFYNHHRTPVLSVLLCAVGLVTGSTCALAIPQGVSWTGIATIGVSVILAGAISFLQTRHAILAIVTALAPIPGLLWAAPISGGSEFGAVPVLAYGFGTRRCARSVACSRGGFALLRGDGSHLVSRHA
jgi:hypothetical protein